MAPTARLASAALGMPTATNFIFPYIKPSQAVAMHRFPKLPPELQRMVWEFALPAPQVITITRERRTRGPRAITTYVSDKPHAPYYEVPAMFRVCRESRAIALERYTESFGERLENPIYFDVERDTLFMVDRWTLEKFHGGISKLTGESQNIEDAVQHMTIATSDIVDRGAIKYLLKFNLATLRLETCDHHHYGMQKSDGERNFAWEEVEEILTEGWKRRARKPAIITHLTRQEMFDSSDIGKEYKARQAAYNFDFCQAIRAILPGGLDLSDYMIHHLAADVCPPIFNGMKIYRMEGYYNQTGRIDLLTRLSTGLIDPHDCKNCALALGWDWKD
jgi:hypothetical protein